MRCTCSALALWAAAAVGAVAEETGFLLSANSTATASEPQGPPPGFIVAAVAALAVVVIVVVYHHGNSGGVDGYYPLSGGADVPTGPVRILSADSRELFAGDIEDSTANHFVVGAGEGTAVLTDRQVLTLERNNDGTYSLRGSQFGKWFAGTPMDTNNNHYVLAKGRDSVNVDDNRLRFKITSAGNGFHIQPCNDMMGKLFCGDIVNKNGNYHLLAKGADSSDVDASRYVFTIKPEGTGQ